MAWIESHQNLREHPKLLDLSRRLSEKKPKLVGHLHFLWWWCIDYATDGDLAKFSKNQIALAADWDGDPENFVSALIESGFIDQDGDRMVVHDWIDFCGELIKKRLEYKSRKKKRSQSISSVLGDSRRKSEKSLLTNHNQPYQPNQQDQVKKIVRTPFQKPSPDEVYQYAKSIGFDLSGQKFCDYYESKGWLVGKSPMKDWKACIRTWKSNGYGTAQNGNTGGFQNGAKRDDGFATAKPGKYPD